jgi:hypothetical protein
MGYCLIKTIYSTLTFNQRIQALNLDFCLFGLPNDSKFRPICEYAYSLAMEDKVALMAIVSYGAMSQPSPDKEAFQIIGKMLKIMNKRLVKVGIGN